MGVPDYPSSSQDVNKQQNNEPIYSNPNLNSNENLRTSENIPQILPETKQNKNNEPLNFNSNNVFNNGKTIF